MSSGKDSGCMGSKVSSNCFPHPRCLGFILYPGKIIICVNKEIILTAPQQHLACSGAAPERPALPASHVKMQWESSVGCGVVIELPSKPPDVFLTRKSFVLLQCLDSLLSCFSFWCNAGLLNLGLAAFCCSAPDGERCGQGVETLVSSAGVGSRAGMCSRSSKTVARFDHGDLGCWRLASG